MNSLRAILVALLLCAMGASAFAGIDDPGNPDGGGGLPGDGGDDPPPGLIDASAIIAPMVAQLAPLAVMAIGFGLAVFAVRTGAAMILEQTGGDAPRGVIPGRNRGESADEQLARAEGYLAAHKSAVRRARNQGYHAYRDTGSMRRYSRDSGGRSNRNSQRGGRRRR